MPDFDFDTVETLFIECLEQPENQQDNWLKTQCGSQPALFEEVNSLLLAHRESEGFLSKPVQFETLNSEQQSMIQQQNEAKFIGQRLGAYELDRLLGRGGMGCVYLAHRIDGEYEQEVAIKIVESQTLETELFRRERQILAQLNHPNIVTLLDGGTLPEHISDGGSYFVMERVKGLQIDEYIKQNKLTGREIVRLMIDVGLVIQEAHQHGIIHCDIKPANILVNDDGLLKLLDFGVAQFLNQKAIQESGHQKTNQRFALTPEYASPRRHQQYMPVIGDDIFSLGILLSHLLSGKAPTVNVAGLYPLPAPDLEQTSQHIENGELRQVFLKSTNIDEKKRYASAKSLVNDLQNWLDHRAVRAVGNSSAYVLKKHIRRNWHYWSLASLVVMALVSTMSIWVNKNRLERESMQMQKITEGMINDLDGTLERLPQTTLIRKQLIETANKRIEILSQGSPENKVITKMHADMLGRLAEVTGHPYALNQGDVEGALSYYRQALLLYQDILPNNENALAIEVDIANTQRKIAEITAYRGDIEEGLQIMEDIREHMETLFADIPFEHRLPMLILYTVEAHGYFHEGNLVKSQDLIEKAWEIARANRQENPRYNLILAFLHEETGHLALLKQSYDNARQEYLAVIEKYQDNDQWQHKRRLARVHNGLACIALREGNTRNARHHYQKIWQAFVELNKKYPNVQAIEKRLNALSPLYQILQTQELYNQPLDKILNCDNPLNFMIPPKSIKKNNSN